MLAGWLILVRPILDEDCHDPADLDKTPGRRDLVRDRTPFDLLGSAPAALRRF